VVVYAKTRWTVTFVFSVLASFALVHGRFGSSGALLAALALVPIVVVHRMRLVADDRGVNVINLLGRQRIPWAEIGDFRMGRVALSTCLDVCRHDGTGVHSWVVTTTGYAAYPRDRVDGIVSDLRERLMLATRESQEDLDARAIEAALAAANRGHYSQASELVAEGRVDSRVMADKLAERAGSAGHDPTGS
jgi:hypothetical protein